MDKKSIRKTNLQLLIDRYYGIAKHGAKADFARRMEKQADYISRCLYPPEKPGAKNVGETFARAIEKEFDLDEYAFDKPGLGDVAQAGAVADGDRESTSDLFDSVSFKALQNLKGIVTPRSLAVIKRIEKAALAGRLKETDLVLLEGIAARFEELNKDQP